MAAATATTAAAPKFAAEQYYDELKATCAAITAPGKGILAADESTNTIGSRFKEIALENTEEARRAYRELLFTTPGALHDYISGVILFEETLGQATAAGVKFVELLKGRGIVPGIKVDKGTAVLDGTDNETATQGLDGLADRCRAYYQQGARFAKWRAVLRISAATGCPSEQAIQENAWGLARYAAICQQCGLAPIVEPEVLMDGTHTIEQAAAATQRVQAAVVKALHDNNVLFEGMLLKPNMVLAGTDLVAQTGRRPSPDDVARWTLHVLTRTLPAAVPGVVFLSGGQSEEEATVNLNAINRAPLRRPWALTFSYGRALQKSTIKAWGGKPENVEVAQKTFFERAKANSEATYGKYTGGAGGAAASESSFVKDYKY